MELDHYLIKEILRYVEQNSDATGKVALNHPEVNGYSDEQVKYHLRMCTDAGFISVANMASGVFATDLRYQGHLELERLRDLLDDPD